MDVVFIQIEFLGNLCVRYVESHEVQTQNPNAQGLVMTGKNRVGHIVESSLTRLTDIALSLGLGLVMTLLGGRWALAIWACHLVWPTQVPDGGEAFGVVDERLYVYHDASIAHVLT